MDQDLTCPMSDNRAELYMTAHYLSIRELEHEHYALRATLPALIHFVQTLSFSGVPLIEVRTVCRFGLNVRSVRGARKAHEPECTCRIFRPNCAPLPHTAHVVAMKMIPSCKKLTTVRRRTTQ